jgi:hypothetical protein
MDGGVLWRLFPDMRKADGTVFAVLVGVRFAVDLTFQSDGEGVMVSVR